MFKKLLTILSTSMLLSACGKGFQVQPASSTRPTQSTTPTTTSTSTTSTTLSSGDGTGGAGGTPGTKTIMCGARTVRLNVPTNYSSQTPVPLVAWFHGLGDDYVNFSNVLTSLNWKSLSDSQNFILMIPDHQNATRDSFLHINGSQFDRQATENELNSVFECIITVIGSQYNISRSRIHFAGFSEGGTFANFAASVISDKIRTASPFAGALSRVQPIARAIPLFFVTGTADSSFNFIQDRITEWENAGYDVTKTFPSGVGHSLIQLHSTVPATTTWNWMSTH